MLAKKFRLKRNNVKEVLTTGSTHRSRLFIIRAEKASQDLTDHEFAIVVSKKLAKKAVPRNLLKRRTLEAIRLNKESLPKTPTLRIVLIPKKICITLDYKDIETDIIYIFQNIQKWLNI